MQINTKYDIGQEVWLIKQGFKKCECCQSSLYDKWIVSGKDTVETLTVQRTITDFSITEYGLFDNYARKEADLYATKEEAQAECDRRNQQ